MISTFRKKRIVIQETLGEKLCKLRLAKNWSYEKAAKESCIARHYLEALEKSRYDEIPGEVYSINFIKTYSTALGFSPKKALELYRTERHVTTKQVHSHTGTTLNRITSFIMTPKALRLASICMAVLSMISYIVYQMYTTIAPPPLVIVSPLDSVEVHKLTITIVGKTTKEASVTINNEPAIVKEDGSFNEKILLGEGLNLVVIKAKRKHGKERMVVRRILVDLSLFGRATDLKFEAQSENKLEIRPHTQIKNQTSKCNSKCKNIRLNFLTWIFDLI